MDYLTHLEKMGFGDKDIGYVLKSVMKNIKL